MTTASAWGWDHILHILGWVVVVLFFIGFPALGYYHDRRDARIVEQRTCHFTNIAEGEIGKFHTPTLLIFAECGADKPHAEVGYLLDAYLRRPDAALQCDLRRDGRWTGCRVL